MVTPVMLTEALEMRCSIPLTFREIQFHTHKPLGVFVCGASLLAVRSEHCP